MGGIAKIAYPEFRRIEVPQSHTGTSPAASMMFAPMFGQFPAIRALISAGKCPTIGSWRSFCRCLDGFLHSGAKRLLESVQRSAKSARAGDRWTLSGRQIGQDCGKVSNDGSERHQLRLTCPAMRSRSLHLEGLWIDRPRYCSTCRDGLRDGGTAPARTRSWSGP